MESSEGSDDDLGRLDIDLDRKSKQHNLTSSNVRAILHVSRGLLFMRSATASRTHGNVVVFQEVITHEHVVAMMKAAIRDTKDLPLFVSLSLCQCVCESESVSVGLSVSVSIT